jgi:hypothetical protein
VSGAASVHCEGAPRDLGLDQGRACRDEIRADAGALGFEPRVPGILGLATRLRGSRRSPAPSLRTPGLVAMARDLARHFPHLAERTAGLASGAGLSVDALLALLAEELLDPLEALFDDTGFATKPPGLRLALRTPLPPTGVVVRTTRPDGGYANLSLTRPGLAAALAGVNERGLAVAALPLGAPDTGERCQAPGVLLAEGCLERLDSVEKALEWCERRPGGGRARLLFADARGARGAIEIDAEKRSRLEVAVLAGARPLETSTAATLRIDPVERCLALERLGAAEEPFRL